jgi:hypothetical protein
MVRWMMSALDCSRHTLEPLQERIETVGDDADLQEVYDTERQLTVSDEGRAALRATASHGWRLLERAKRMISAWMWRATSP